MLSVRFFYLQIVEGEVLKNQREKNINTFEYIYPKRGRIISRDNEVLVEDEKIFSVAIDLEQKPSIKSIKLLSEIFQDKLEQIEIESIFKKSIASGKKEIFLSNLSLEHISKFLVRNN